MLVNVTYYNQNAGPLTIAFSGWGLDGSYFSSLIDTSNVIIVDHYDPFLVIELLADLIKDLVHEGLHLKGFSMGAYVVLDILRLKKWPVLSVELSGLRPEYPAVDIRRIQKNITRKGERFYSSFLSLAAGTSPSAMQWCTGLESLAKWPKVDELLLGLEYLGKQRLSGDMFASVPNLRLIHGENDVIAPCKEMQEFCAQYDLELEIVPGYSHLLMP